jgi:hypothetical protein
MTDDVLGEKVWNKIPDRTEILITHGPPLLILDSKSTGSETLKK